MTEQDQNPSEMCFCPYDERDQMWQTQLIEIIHRRETDPYYSRFGFDQLVIPTGATFVSARMEELTQRFNERYAFRMLNYGTLPKWQMRLQNRFDEVVDKYNRAYALYSEHEEGIMDDIMTGIKRTVHGENQASGTDKTTGKSVSKSIDTPDSRVNESDEYADSYSKSDNETQLTHGRKDVNEVTDTTEQTGILLENINRTINAYRDVDTEFIKEFENNFLNVFWY